MRLANTISSHVDGMLFWQCVCICANPQLYAPKPIERRFLERVMRAYRGGRRLRDDVQSAAGGIVHTCKERRQILVRSPEIDEGRISFPDNAVV